MMNLLKSNRFLLSFLLVQVVLWPLLFLGLYHFGHTPYWFDNQVQAGSLYRVMGVKTYLTEHKHNPYTDIRFRHISPTHQILTVEGRLVSKEVENWTIDAGEVVQQVPVYFVDEKTQVHCTEAKEFRLSRTECSEDAENCLNQEILTSCGNSDQEKLSQASISDTVKIKNLYRYSETNELLLNHTQFIQID